MGFGGEVKEPFSKKTAIFTKMKTSTNDNENMMNRCE